MTPPRFSRRRISPTRSAERELLMELSSAAEFIKMNHHAVLATTRLNGQPQLSPVTVAVDSSGRLVVSTRQRAAKVHNLKRNPIASICVFTDRFFGDWIQIDGEVEIVALPDAMEPLIDYYRAVAGEHPDWQEYRSAMIDEQRVLLVISPTSVGPAALR
jgi:PPOX class probable F420-dependent enzyme